MSDCEMCPGARAVQPAPTPANPQVLSGSEDSVVREVVQGAGVIVVQVGHDHQPHVSDRMPIAFNWGPISSSGATRIDAAKRQFGQTKDLAHGPQDPELRARLVCAEGALQDSGERRTFGVYGVPRPGS